MLKKWKTNVSSTPKHKGSLHLAGSHVVEENDDLGLCLVRNEKLHVFVVLAQKCVRVL